MKTTTVQSYWQSLRNTLGPLLLILLCPPFVMILWYVNSQLGGSLPTLFDTFASQGILQTIIVSWQPFFWGSKQAWIIIISFAVFQLILMRFMPGKKFYGPVTPKGNVPVYKANGVPVFFTTVIAFCICSFYLKIFSPTIIYDNFSYLLGALNITSLLVCLLLYFKGRFFPSSTDFGVTRNPLFDYYWGTELYPRVLGFDIKMFIICRFGMMSWALILISYAAKQDALFGLSNSMLVAVILQLIYLAKFYIWETGYLRSLDIMHDRAGFYTCWGCLVWVPCVYTSPTMYLVLHPIHLSVWLSALILMLGTLSILINYFADRQRQLVRATEGNCKIWGKSPKTIVATYQTTQGETKQNLLLASGWWGISRHFHYIPEILAAFFWSLPALFTHFIPYFYVSFLTILLLDRAFRDDRRCAEKYGRYWIEYCKLVPNKILPFKLCRYY